MTARTIYTLTASELKQAVLEYIMRDVRSFPHVELSSKLVTFSINAEDVTTIHGLIVAVVDHQ